jgi:ATP-dependent Lon protease
MSIVNLFKNVGRDVVTPAELPVIPLRDAVLFPRMVMPLQAGRPASLKALEAALEKDHFVLVVAQKDPSTDEVGPHDLHTTGTVVRVLQTVRMPDGSVQMLVHGHHRAVILGITQTSPYLRAHVQRVYEDVEKTIEVEALMRQVVSQVEQYVEKSQGVPAEVVTLVRNVEEPGALADMIALAPEMDFGQRQDLLETHDPVARLRKVAVFLGKQLEILDLRNKIQAEVQKGMEKTQREFLLREQLKAIQRELGEADPLTAEIDELRKAIEAAGMPEEVKARALKEVDRLAAMPQHSPEVGMLRTYIDWLVSLPWSKGTEDRLDLKEAARILNEDHYGLEKVKERILEFLAVRKLSPTLRTPILCFVGPPGVGKTSLGRSIARALGRKFVRISLGGVRDEAEIRGHRRTYIGALPGRIIQGMKNAGVNNPLFVLDEIDKIGMDFRGDPSSALLEVLDPEQNFAFSDHYLEVPFDLSKVMFITTANVLDTIPPALRDRMEVIRIAGYTEEEKLQIAKGYLVPKQLQQHGLSAEQVRFTDEALRHIIREYTKEAGVRNLDREIAAVCRKVARQIAEGDVTSTEVVADDLYKYLGPPRFPFGAEELVDQVGVATGLAWTEFGGDTLAVEATLMDGKSDVILTGQLGQVMQESARAALSYARSHARELGIDPKRFENQTVHVHVPAGAVPKDGPSAGVTMATAIISAASGVPVRGDVAMTGEITLRGRVLPVGGIKEKILAAHRAGIRTVVLPAKNRKDLLDIPEDVRSEMRFVWAEHINDVLAVALRREPAAVSPDTLLAGEELGPEVEPAPQPAAIN